MGARDRTLEDLIRRLNVAKPDEGLIIGVDFGTTVRSSFYGSHQLGGADIGTRVLVQRCRLLLYELKGQETSLD